MHGVVAGILSMPRILLCTCVPQGLVWPSLRVISSTGEASSPEDYFWLYALTRYQAPVIEYCGGEAGRGQGLNLR
jgi:acyl-coenzyme A synthetase/AMP-(fatty) acid ligase